MSKVGRKFRATPFVIPIGIFMIPSIKVLRKNLREKDITEENLQSRYPESHFDGLSNKSGDLVLTTGNKVRPLSGIQLYMVIRLRVLESSKMFKTWSMDFQDMKHYLELYGKNY